MAGAGTTGRALALLLGAALAVPAAAQTFVQRLNAGVNAVADTAYGIAVATDGNRVAVGELYGLTGAAPAVPAGAVEVWRRQGAAMVREQRLLAPQPVGGHLFGLRLALSGDRLAVVEWGAPGNRGQVHVYRESAGTWLHEQTVAPADPGAAAQVLGVALLGDLLLVGLASGEGEVDGAPGRVEFWRHDGTAWQLAQLLQPLDSSVADGFGFAIAMGEDANGGVFAAIGAPWRNQARGALYVFSLQPNNTFVQEQRLLLPQAMLDEAFGTSVALRGHLVVGGAPNVSAPSTGGGRIGLWRRSGSGDFPWLLDNAFDGNGAAGDRFGNAVALPTARDVVVGAPFRDLVPPIGPVLLDAGAATGYARRRSGVPCPTLWSTTGGLGNPGALASTNGFLGWSLAASTLVAIGAPLGEVTGVGRSGFVDVLVHDRLHDSDFDCSH